VEGRRARDSRDGANRGVLAGAAHRAARSVVRKYLEERCREGNRRQVSVRRNMEDAPRESWRTSMPAEGAQLAPRPLIEYVPARGLQSLGMRAGSETQPGEGSRSLTCAHPDFQSRTLAWPAGPASWPARWPIPKRATERTAIARSFHPSGCDVRRGRMASSAALRSSCAARCAPSVAEAARSIATPSAAGSRSKISAAWDVSCA